MGTQPPENTPHPAATAKTTNWRDYITVKDFGHYLSNALIENVLDQFMRTPEGRETIWNAAALHGGKITIAPSNEGSHANREPGILDIDLNQISKYSTAISPDGTQKDKLSLQNALFHELTHLTDPRCLPQNFLMSKDMFFMGSIFQDTNRYKEYADMHDTVINYMKTNVWDFSKVEKIPEFKAYRENGAAGLEDFYAQNKDLMPNAINAFLKLKEHFIEKYAIDKTNTFMKNTTMKTFDMDMRDTKSAAPTMSSTSMTLALRKRILPGRQNSSTRQRKCI